MNLPIQGRGRPVARFQPHTSTSGVIRIDCERDLAVWYELPLTRATLTAMLAEMDAATDNPEDGSPTSDAPVPGDEPWTRKPA